MSLLRYVLYVRQTPLRCLTRAALLLFLIIGSACSDSSDSNPSRLDTGQRSDSAVSVDQNSTIADQLVEGSQLPFGDGSQVLTETSTVLPDTSTASSGLGQICTGAGTCPSGETCLFMEQDATQGICLRQCNAPDTPCSVPDEQKYFSPCMSYYNSEIGGNVTVCMVACEWQGTTYECPDATHYKCVDKGFMKICLPQ